MALYLAHNLVVADFNFACRHSDFDGGIPFLYVPLGGKGSLDFARDDKMRTKVRYYVALCNSRL